MDGCHAICCGFACSVGLVSWLRGFEAVVWKKTSEVKGKRPDLFCMTTLHFLKSFKSQDNKMPLLVKETQCGRAIYGRRSMLTFDEACILVDYCNYMPISSWCQLATTRLMNQQFAEKLALSPGSLAHAAVLIEKLTTWLAVWCFRAGQGVQA